MVEIDLYGKNFSVQMFEGQLHSGCNHICTIALIPLVRAHDDQIHDGPTPFIVLVGEVLKCRKGRGQKRLHRRLVEPPPDPLQIRFLRLFEYNAAAFLAGDIQQFTFKGLNLIIQRLSMRACGANQPHTGPIYKIRLANSILELRQPSILVRPKRVDRGKISSI